MDVDGEEEDVPVENKWQTAGVDKKQKKKKQSHLTTTGGLSKYINSSYLWMTFHVQPSKSAVLAQEDAMGLLGAALLGNMKGVALLPKPIPGIKAKPVTSPAAMPKELVQQDKYLHRNQDRKGYTEIKFGTNPRVFSLVFKLAHNFASDEALDEKLDPIAIRLCSSGIGLEVKKHPSYESKQNLYLIFVPIAIPVLVVQSTLRDSIRKVLARRGSKGVGFSSEVVSDPHVVVHCQYPNNSYTKKKNGLGARNKMVFVIEYDVHDLALLRRILDDLRDALRDKLAARALLIFACDEEPGTPEHDQYMNRLGTQQVFNYCTSSLQLPTVLGDFGRVHEVRVMTNIDSEEAVVFETLSISLRDLIMGTTLANGRPAFIGLSPGASGAWVLYFNNKSEQEVEALKWNKYLAAKVMFELLLRLNVHPDDVMQILRAHFTVTEHNIALNYATWDEVNRVAHVSSDLAADEEDDNDDDLVKLQDDLDLDMSLLEEQDGQDVVRAQMNGLLLDDNAQDLASVGGEAFREYREGANPLNVPSSGVTWQSHVAMLRNRLEELNQQNMQTDEAAATKESENAQNQKETEDDPTDDSEKSGASEKTSGSVAADADGSDNRKDGVGEEGEGKDAQSTSASASSGPASKVGETEFPAEE
jgi:hypothetical protein